MILETAQLLCTIHWKTGSIAPYRATHSNHPCTKWAGETLENYLWLCMLGLELCKEYTRRYEKTHKTQEVIRWCWDNLPNVPQNGLTAFALAMPPEYVVPGDPVASYRNYYKGAKAKIATWKTEMPSWW